jgi:dihydrofolate synthase/folylpolyglutamate synthase
MSSNSFQTFIEEKPLYYKEIDHERVHLAYGMLKPHILQPLTIHVVGTNGKGSTGRIMATLLHLSGKKVGHFSSPHILKFNERIWIEGEDVSDVALEQAHKKLFSILGQEMSNDLSYFEYTTLLAFVVMEKVEVIVLEAGLGGEFDATNVCAKALSVITPIGLDHQEFLGESVEEIARTKMNSVQEKFVLALQVEDEVYGIARKIVKNKNAELYEVKDFESMYSSEYKALKVLTEQMGWSEYLFENSLTALYALKKLKLHYELESIKNVELFGRFHRFMPNVIVDVGHNLLAAKAIVKAVKKKERKNGLVLVYNALNDKDYVSILETFQPHVKRVEIIAIDTPRAVDVEMLKNALKHLKIPYSEFSAIDEKEEYLVFGSFYVVEAFLKKNA